MAKKKKKRRKLTPFTKLLCLLLVGISVYFLYAVGREIVTTVTLQRQLAQVQEKLQEVKDENKYLTDQKEKLQDPDYVENYARGNYQLSKDGDQIFYLPEDSSK